MGKKMENRFELRLAVEDFLYLEAEYLDNWQLDEWMSLWDEGECRYEIGPLGLGAAIALQNPSPGKVLFLVADDRFRLEQRIVRLKKNTCHVEFPHSLTRHNYSNIRAHEGDGVVLAKANFITYRTKRGVTITYPGEIHCELKRVSDGTFRLVKKRIYLDLDALDPHGKVSIIL